MTAKLIEQRGQAAYDACTRPAYDERTQPTYDARTRAVTLRRWLQRHQWTWACSEHHREASSQSAPRRRSHQPLCNRALPASQPKACSQTSSMGRTKPLQPQSATRHSPGQSLPSPCPAPALATTCCLQLFSGPAPPSLAPPRSPGSRTPRRGDGGGVPTWGTLIGWPGTPKPNTA